MHQGQGLEIPYCKYLLDNLSHEKEKAKKAPAANSAGLEALRQQIVTLQEKMVHLTEISAGASFKELHIVVPECGGLTVDMQIAQYDTLAALKFAVAGAVNTNRHWSSHIHFDDLFVVDAEEKELEDAFLVSEWGQSDGFVNFSSFFSYSLF